MKLRNTKNKKLVKLASKFQPWDFGYNLDIEQEMFKRMYQFFSSDSPIIVGSEKIARDIKLAISLLEIIQERDSSIELLSNKEWINVKYVNTKNSKRFTPLENFEHPTIKNELRISKAWNLYNKLRYNKMLGWWE